MGGEDAVEIPDDHPDVPDGSPGKLTDDQRASLREMWKGYFDWCAKASGTNTGGTGAGFQEDDVDPKKAGIPKGDAAKDEAKMKEEQAGLNALLQTYGPDSLKKALWQFVKMDAPDAVFLRFLRARKWDVTRAMGMFATCLKWRLDNDVEALVNGGDLDNGKNIEKFLDQQRSGKTYSLGTASNEQPICMVHVRKHFIGRQTNVSMQKFVIYAMECFRLMMQPPQEKCIIFFDLTGFGLVRLISAKLNMPLVADSLLFQRNMDWNCILFIVKCLEAYYPESLGIMYIHNAPWIFSGIWRILSPLLDPVVRSKIAFTKTAKDVEDRIPAERLIADLGGNVAQEFEFTEIDEHDNDKVHDLEGREKSWKKYMALADEFEAATRKLIETDGKE